MPSAAGRYRIDHVLGSGAFASVWLAHDEVLDAPVAVKVLAGGLIDDLDVRNRFLEEARILRRADSERLVRVHDIGELEDGRPYFVMSYADRGTLADRMRGRRLPLAEALRLAVEVARGVEVINRLGIIHRDIKPSNVLFQSTTDGGERLLIADLGLAKALAQASGAFTLPVGTPGYMSPEQARFGGGLDVRADVYGLGALTYHLITGRAPGTAPVQVPPSARRPGLPPSVDQVVMRALEADRERRWPSAEAFAAALAEPLRSAHDDATVIDVPTGEIETVRDEPPVGAAAGAPADDAAPATDAAPGSRSPDTTRDGELLAGTAGTATVRDDGRPVGAAAGARSARDETPREVTEPGSGSGYAGPPDRTLEAPVPSYEATMRRPVVEAQAEDATVAAFADEQPYVGAPYAGRGAGPPNAGPSYAGPIGGPPYTGPPSASVATRGSGRNRLIIVAGLVGVLAVGGGGAYLVGRMTRPSKPKDDFVAVADTTGKLTLRVPPTWKPQPQQNLWPIPVSDRAHAPALRATPNYEQFVKDDVPTPGVFAGLTRDLTVTLPPATIGRHRDKCTEGTSRPYRHGALSGQITPWKCPGTITISEVGLRDSAGNALWIRVKLTGPPDITQKILDSIQIKG